MLDNFNILIIGGDERYLEIIEQLAMEKANVKLIGYNQISFAHSNITKLDGTINGYFEDIDAIILPVSGTDEFGRVDADFANQSIVFKEELIENTPDHCTIYSGISTPYLKEISELSNRNLICIFERDDIAVLNSIPTSEGALQLAMENTAYTIHGSQVFILGFGRIGMTISRLFSAVGANVSVVVRKAVDAARIKEFGMNPIKLSELKHEIDRANIIINTIRFPILNSDVITQMEKNALIIDLASIPGGTDFEFAKKSDIKAIHALGMPGKVAPKTAGKVIADVLIELITKSDRFT